MGLILSYATLAMAELVWKKIKNFCSLNMVEFRLLYIAVISERHSVLLMIHLNFWKVWSFNDGDRFQVPVCRNRKFQIYLVRLSHLAFPERFWRSLKILCPHFWKNDFTSFIRTSWLCLLLRAMYISYLWNDRPSVFGEMGGLQTEDPF